MVIPRINCWACASIYKITLIVTLLPISRITAVGMFTRTDARSVNTRSLMSVRDDRRKTIVPSNMTTVGQISWASWVIRVVLVLHGYKIRIFVGKNVIMVRQKEGRWLLSLSFFCNQRVKVAGWYKRINLLKKGRRRNFYLGMWKSIRKCFFKYIFSAGIMTPLHKPRKKLSFHND